MKPLKIFAMASVCALALGVVCVLPGCGPSAEEHVRQAVTTQYDAYKNADDATLTEIVTTLENESLKELGIEGTEYATVIIDGFDYNIDKIEINKDQATVTMTFAGKSYTAFLNKISETRDALANDPAFTALSHDERLSEAGKMLMDGFKQLPVNNETTTLSYELVDGTWQAADVQAGLQDIDNVLFAK